jgi:ribosomal RNA-processing protein 12
MIIDEEADSEGQAEGDNVKGMAYRESLTSADGFTRGQRGAIKFNKDTKKRRRENAEQDEDVEMADISTIKTQVAKQHKQRKLGSEFKAKVNGLFGDQGIF